MRIYSVQFNAVTVSAVQDFFEISPAANKPCCLLGLQLWQSSDVQDAAEEILRVSVFRVPATLTSGSGGSAGTANVMAATGAAAGFSCEVNNTTVATTSGTLVQLAHFNFNIRAGLDVFLPEEFRPWAVNATALCVRLDAAPVDPLTMDGVAYVGELG